MRIRKPAHFYGACNRNPGVRHQGVFRDFGAQEYVLYTKCLRKRQLVAESEVHESAERLAVISVTANIMARQ